MLEERTPKITEDGSSTLYIPEWNEHYHSSHGALQEAQHVFLKNGLHKIDKDNLTLIEYGFGTGLNAFITAKEADELGKNIQYIGLEKYPINFEELSHLNYANLIQDEEDYFGKIHRIPWNYYYPISAKFTLKKVQMDFREYTYEEGVDLVYFDAFGYRVQPKLWQEDVFQNIYNHMNSNALLTTYSSKGVVRRTLESIGFEVEKVEGPKGKREMLNAWKR